MPEIAFTLPIWPIDLVFRWPLALLALLLPPIIRYGLTPAPASRASLRLPHLDSLALPVPKLLSWRRSRVGLAALAFGLLVLAASRPVSLGEQTHVPQTGRDLMLVVDISESMEERDWGLGTTRMQVVKQVVHNFIRRRHGDRVGVVVFGSRPYLQTPLTFDLHAVEQQWKETGVGLAGPATAMGDAIGLTIKHLRNAQANHKVMVLISDGAANAGTIKTNEAIAAATQFGLRIYTIGIGSVANDAKSGRYDEVLLRTLAGTTGGEFFEARMRSELESVYQSLDTLEPATFESDIRRKETELYPWPLALALLLVIVLFLGETRSQVKPAAVEPAQ